LRLRLRLALLQRQLRLDGLLLRLLRTLCLLLRERGQRLLVHLLEVPAGFLLARQLGHRDVRVAKQRQVDQRSVRTDRPG
jgi:hypothetical protein